MSGKQSSLFPNASKPSNTLNVLQGLDRAEVEPLGIMISHVLGAFCDRILFAGSLRRGKNVVNDLDFVVLPKILPPGCWVNMLKALRKDFDAVTQKQGDKLATLYLPFSSLKQGPGHIQVDFYRADASTWGILLLVRTGSKEHNVKLCNLAIQKGLRLQYSVGLTDRSGRVVAGRTEEEVFHALGLPYIDPKDREV